MELRAAPFVGWIQDLSREDPYWITPLLMGATMFLQQKMAMTKIKDRKADKSYEVYLSLYQAITGTEEADKVFKRFSRDFFDLIIVESSGIGQADSEIVDISDLSLYVMTPEYGAAMQLEKIDMLDYADFVAINKFDRPQALEGQTYKLKWPESEHAIYITINDIIVGGRRRPFEVFINSKNMEHFAWTVGLTRMISAVFRRGGDVSFVVEELKAVFDPRGGAWMQGKYIPSILAAIGGVVEQHMIATGFIAGEGMGLKSDPQAQVVEGLEAGKREGGHLGDVGEGHVGPVAACACAGDRNVTGPAEHEGIGGRHAKRCDPAGNFSSDGKRQR